MNTSQSIHPPANSIAARYLLSALLIGGAMVSAAAGAPEATKPYTLFMGADIAVGQGTELYPVRDVFGGSWVVGINDQLVKISTKSGPINMKVTPLLTLTEISAALSNLKAERAYTFANDPAVKLTRSLNQAAVTNVGYHTAVNQATAVANGAISASEMGINRTSASGTSSPGTTSESTEQMLTTTQQSLSAANGSAGSDLFATGSQGDTGDFDALDVSFDISAGRPLNLPYIVTMTKFKERGTEAGSFRNLVFAKALDPITATATSVHFQQAGFPPGYELQSFEIHLYNDGVEVATNVAAQRQTLTPDEAFDYVKSKYISAHKDQTMPPVPVLGTLPGALREQLAAGKYSETFFVMVSKDGLADEAYADVTCSKKLDDPFLVSVVRSIRFKPALSVGKPVDGVAALNLAKLKI
jgi:hypothetical protein